MTDWYYATADRQRHGPLRAEQLRALAMSGAIDAQTLVWREGEPGWRALHAFAAELELPAAPPPLPATAAPAVAMASAPRPGMSGVVIALLIVVGGMFALAVLGILAAIAVPAYNDYTLRAQATSAIVQAKALQVQVAEFVAVNGRCPTNDDEDFGTPESYAGAGLARVEFGEFEDSDLGGLEATLAAPGKAALDGKALWLEYHPDRSGWECSSEVEDRHLPVDCRG
ncbi:pilin [Pseudoxanthomonas koreensis]|uniref:pilin n=1 Tax=Pseudoxanthomonas koreensis TaxID=266061 RepID=UPI00139142D6|nr:pilin [Pseudoxanthomonas koreensis]KAF1697150.1 pilus assembly protein PilA [Pseudoxanthomonas koreensis]